MKRNIFIIILGVLCIVSAVTLTGYNLWCDQNAGKLSEQALEIITDDAQNNKVKTENQNITPDYILNPEMAMPEKEVDGNFYIGYIEMPSLDIQLPVLSELTNNNLNIAPCRYKGSAYLDNMIIGAHNFRSHFGNLSQLAIGDAISFTDIDGNVFSYEVADFENLRGTQVKDMSSGEWDLTLFTCNYDGSSRITVRCVKAT